LIGVPELDLVVICELTQIAVWIDPVGESGGDQPIGDSVGSRRRISASRNRESPEPAKCCRQYENNPNQGQV
jgi:hypothetical protein